MPSYDLIRHQERTYQDAAIAAERTGVVLQRHPGVELSERLERIYSQMQMSWAQNAVQLSAFFHNAQFTQDQITRLKARAQAAVPINVIYPATEQAVAMLTTNKPRFQATAREDSDVKTAKVVADLMSWVWEQSDGNAQLKLAVYDYYVKGRGVLLVYWDPNRDYGRGELCIQCVDPLDILPDPNSKDRLYRDASHIVISRIFTREQIEAMWPDAARVMAQAQAQEPDHYAATSGARWQGTYTDGQMPFQGGSGVVAQDGQQIGQFGQRDPYHERYKVIERYTKVKVRYSHVKDRTTGIEKVMLPEEFEQFLQQPILIVQGQPIVDPKMIGEIQQAVEAGQVPVEAVQPATMEDALNMGVIEVREVLLDRIQLTISIGGQLYWEGYLPIKDYPIIPLNNRHDRNPYPMSDIGYVKPMQELLNKFYMLMVANAASSTNQKILVPRGGIDKNEWERTLAKAGAAVLEYDAEIGAPVIVTPAPFPNALFQQIQLLKQEIENELGIFRLMQGDAADAPSTYKGTLAMDEFGQRRIKSKLDDIETALNHLGRVCVQFFPHVYTEEKVIRLVAPNNTVRESVANQLAYDDLYGDAYRINDLTMGEYDVVVVSGSTLPSNRWALAEYYNQLYQIGLIDQVEALKKSELVDAEGVLERSGQMAQMAAYIQQLEEEVKSLKGDMQTEERKVVNLGQRLEVEKFKASLAGPREQAKKAAMLFEARMADAVQQKKQEQRGASNPRTSR